MPVPKKRSGHQAARLDHAWCARMVKLALHGSQPRRIVRLEDGRGLALVIKKTGAAHWRQRLVIRGTGKRVEGGHGPFSFVGLSKARTPANEAFALACEGKNPFPGSPDRGTVNEPSVADAVRAYQARRVQAGRVKQSGADDKFKIFERHAKPIADRPVSGADLGRSGGAFGADRDRHRSTDRSRVDACSRGMGEGWGLTGEAAFTKADLEAKLPSRKRENDHQPALPWQRIGEAWRVLSEPTTPASRRNAATLRLIVLTAARPRLCLPALRHGGRAVPL